MIKIFTTPSCSSCRKAKKWLNEHKIDYKEVNLFNTRITGDDINEMLENTENGFEDIISKRSKVIKENSIDIDSMTIKELKEFIIKNPSILKRPIIIGEDKIQVGYNEEDIRTFVPKRLREIIMCTNCKAEDDCDYQNALKKYLGELAKE